MTVTHAENFYTAHTYDSMAILFGIAAVAAVAIGLTVLRDGEDAKLTKTGKIVTSLGAFALLLTLSIGMMANNMKSEMDTEFKQELQSKYGMTSSRNFSDLALAPQTDGGAVTDIRVSKDGAPATVTLKVQDDQVTLYELDGKEIPRV